MKVVRCLNRSWIRDSYTAYVRYNFRGEMSGGYVRIGLQWFLYVGLAKRLHL